MIFLFSFWLTYVILLSFWVHLFIVLASLRFFSDYICFPYNFPVTIIHRMNIGSDAKTPWIDREEKVGAQKTCRVSLYREPGLKVFLAQKT